MVPGFVVAIMALACANASGAVPAGVGEASMPLIAPSDPGPSNPTEFGFQGIAVDFVEWP